MTRRLKYTALLMFTAVLICASGAGAQPGFSTFTTVRMSVKYQKGITMEQARRVGEFLQGDYDYLSTQLKVDLSAPLEVRIYDTSGKYLSATGQQKAWRTALWQRGVLHVQPVPDQKHSAAFDKALSYELVLALLDGTGRKGVPRWLRESFAAYHSGVMSDLTPPVGYAPTTFADLDQDLQTFTTPPRRNDLVFLLGQTMKFFVEQYGEEKALGVFGAFDGERSPEEMLGTHFGADYTVIEQAWAASMVHQTVPLKKSPPKDQKY